MTLAYAPETQAAPSIIKVMERLGVRMSFAKGEEIFGQDEDADLIYCVQEGAVRTTHSTSAPGTPSAGSTPRSGAKSAR